MSESLSVSLDASWSSVGSPILLWAMLSGVMIAVLMGVYVFSIRADTTPDKGYRGILPTLATLSLFSSVAAFGIMVGVISTNQYQSTALDEQIAMNTDWEEVSIREVSTNTYSIAARDNASDIELDCLARFQDHPKTEVGLVKTTYDQPVVIDCEEDDRVNTYPVYTPINK